MTFARFVASTVLFTTLLGAIALARPGLSTTQARTTSSRTTPPQTTAVTSAARFAAFADREATPPRSTGRGAAAVRGTQAAAPFAPMYLVMSRETYDQLRDLVSSAVPENDGSGTPLVLAQVRAFQLDAISQRIHEQSRHCGGYFAFATRAEAHAFLRGGVERARKTLPTKLEYTLDNAATVTPWLGQVQTSNIVATITHLSNYQNRYYTTTTGRQAAEWLRDTWQGLAAGRTDVTTELQGCSTCSTQPSVVLTIRGTELANEIVVLGAHLDSISGSGFGGATQRAPGADDDASGIATLTEVLRIALASGWKPRRTVKFMGYAAEEVGLRGSNAIAQAHRAAGANVVGVLQMDMTNYKASTTVDMRLVTDYSNEKLKTFLTALFDAYLAPRGLKRGLDTCGYACSDHASWTGAGYPAAYFFEAGDAGGAYFPYIHTGNDTLANMAGSADNSAKFALLGLAFLGEMGKTPFRP